MSPTCLFPQYCFAYESSEGVVKRQRLVTSEDNEESGLDSTVTGKQQYVLKQGNEFDELRRAWDEAKEPGCKTQ